MPHATQWINTGHLRQWWCNWENDRCWCFWISFCPSFAWASYRVRQTQRPRSTIVCCVAHIRATAPYRCPMRIADFAISTSHRIYWVNYLAVRIQFPHWIGPIDRAVAPYRPFPPDMFSPSNSSHHPIRSFLFAKIWERKEDGIFRGEMRRFGTRKDSAIHLPM